MCMCVCCIQAVSVRNVLYELALKNKQSAESMDALKVRLTQPQRKDVTLKG